VQPGSTSQAGKASYPAQGKAVTFLVPYDAGASTDLCARVLAPFLEKNLGVPVQIVNRPGAGGQLGITEVAQSKPDGYTLGIIGIPSTSTMYMDPDRKAVFNRKSFQPLASQVDEPDMVAVRSNSPYKSMKDLVDAAKANPEKITVGFTGILTHQHLAVLDLQRMTGARFAVVSFDSGGPARTALLGGHIEDQVADPGTFAGAYKSGDLRILGVMAQEENPLFPGIKTLESQGYKLYMGTTRLLVTPAGLPQEVADTLAEALKKAIQSPEHVQKMTEAGYTVRYRTPEESDKMWAQMDEQVKPLVDLAKQQTK
jgi:tripartite-type tricarboxylate transporter receptor subunit TctC